MNRVNRTAVAQRQQWPQGFPSNEKKKLSAGHMAFVSHAFPGLLVLLLPVGRSTRHDTPWRQIISLDKSRILGTSNEVQQSSGNHCTASTLSGQRGCERSTP
jgi:hypothetical protein